MAFAKSQISISFSNIHAHQRFATAWHGIDKEGSSQKKILRRRGLMVSANWLALERQS